MATWGIIKGRTDLIRPPGKILPADATFAYDGQAKTTSCKAPLNPHHTHFFLVDDGSEGAFGKEIGE